MKVPVAPTDAEKKLQAELDSSRLEYENESDQVRTCYLLDLEILHAKFASAQSAAIERYHQSARAELSEILDGLSSALEDDELPKFSPSIIDEHGVAHLEIHDPLIPLPARSGFFAPSEPLFDAEQNSLVAPASRVWFRRGRHRP